MCEKHLISLNRIKNECKLSSPFYSMTDDRFHCDKYELTDKNMYCCFNRRSGLIIAVPVADAGE